MTGILVCAVIVLAYVRAYDRKRDDEAILAMKRRANQVGARQV
jgi:hypothetical protein